MHPARLAKQSEESTAGKNDARPARLIKKQLTEGRRMSNLRNGSRHSEAWQGEHHKSSLPNQARTQIVTGGRYTSDPHSQEKHGMGKTWHAQPSEAHSRKHGRGNISGPARPIKQELKAGGTSCVLPAQSSSQRNTWHVQNIACPARPVKNSEHSRGSRGASSLRSQAVTQGIAGEPWRIQPAQSSSHSETRQGDTIGAARLISKQSEISRGGTSCTQPAISGSGETLLQSRKFHQISSPEKIKSNTLEPYELQSRQRLLDQHGKMRWKRVAICASAPNDPRE